MPALNLISRVPKQLITTVTFTGAAGLGAIGTVAIATVTGRVLLQYVYSFCSTLLTGASATIAFGTANNTGGLIAATTATDIDANEFWTDTTPEVEVTVALIERVVSANLILTVATANVTAGVLEFGMLWTPMSANGNMG